jgi:phosphoribosylglycinamide formyltransferase 1
VFSVVVLISGAGSNLEALLQATQSDDFPVDVIAVGADRQASGLDHARARGIPVFVCAPADYPDRASWGDALLAQVQRFGADLVVLSGFMRLLPSRVVAALSPRVINTHPAYLPEFPGAHAVRDALAAGTDATGASVIVVDTGVDSGPIVARRRVPVLPEDTEAVLHDRIKLVEQELLAQSLLDIATGTIDLKELVRA